MKGSKDYADLMSEKTTIVMYTIIICFHVKDNILPCIMGKEGSQADYKRKRNVGSFNFESSSFSRSPHTEYGSKKVSTIMEDNKCYVPVIKINFVTLKNIHHVPVSGNVFHPVPIP